MGLRSGTGPQGLGGNAAVGEPPLGYGPGREAAPAGESQLGSGAAGSSGYLPFPLLSPSAVPRPPRRRPRAGRGPAASPGGCRCRCHPGPAARRPCLRRRMRPGPARGPGSALGAAEGRGGFGAVPVGHGERAAAARQRGPASASCGAL